MGRRAAIAIFFASVLAMMSAQSAYAALDLSSTFDTDNEGWETIENEAPGPATYADGAIQVGDTTPGIGAGFISPQDWAGDATDNFGGTLQFDLKSSEAWSGGVTAIIIPADADEQDDVLCFFDDTSVGTTYGTYSFTLDTSDALRGGCATPASAGKVAATLSQLTFVQIQGDDDTVSGEVTSLDNVSLSGGGPPPPYEVQTELNIDHGKLSSNFLNPFFAFFGVLDADDPTCAAHRKVVVYRKRKGPDEKLGARTTNNEGGYRFAYDRKKGTYYAKSREVDLGLPTCLEATSDTFKIN